MQISPHLHIQHSLQKMLAPHEVWLEKRFPNIHRIADLAWPAKKLIFEVQLSPITAEEVRARNWDYAQEGYRVVWILHDRHFNRFHLTPAEVVLRSLPHYFVGFNPLGEVYFYDQSAQIKRKKRLKRSPRFPVNFQQLRVVDKQVARQFPLERQKWPICFEGDLFHQELHEKAKKSPISPIRWLLRPIRIIWHLLLEKTSL